MWARSHPACNHVGKQRTNRGQVQVVRPARSPGEFSFRRPSGQRAHLQRARWKLPAHHDCHLLAPVDAREGAANASRIRTQGVDEMGLTATVDIDQEKYGKLLAKTLPKIIETDEEFDRMAALLEELTIPERELTPEEDALASLPKKLVVDYDDQYYAIPDAKPHEMVRFLMEQR